MTHKINKILSAILSLYFIVQIPQNLFSQVNSGDLSMQFNRMALPSGATNLSLSNANLDVDLYTGRLKASLPLASLESADLSIPISIDYTGAGGIKPMDINTPVGLGWTLNAGGSISRIVRGLPDEVSYGYNGANQSGATVVNDYTNHITSTGFPESYNNIFRNQVSSLPPIDGEPDIYVIQTPMFNLRFTFDQNGNPVPTQNTGIKISISGFNTSSSFVITDELGNQYYFGSSAASRETTNTKFFSQSFSFISTWYLDRIMTYNGRDVVTFSYLAGRADTTYYYQQTKDFTSNFATWSTYPPTTEPTSYTSVNARNVSISTVIITPCYIQNIITQLGEADFSYSYNSNQYISQSNSPLLTSIMLKAFDPVTGTNSTVLKTFNLYFQEFEDDIIGYTQPYSDNGMWSFAYRRLLDHVSVTGSGGSPILKLYQLGYNHDYTYPDRGLNQNCDYWGYINSTTFLADGGTNGGADASYFTNLSTRLPTFYNHSGSNVEIPTASLLSLNSVNNLLGETYVINYELNTYFDGSVNQNAGGIRVYNITKTVPSGQSFYTNYIYNDANGHSTGQLYNDFYKRVRVYFSSNCCSLATLSFVQSPYNISDLNGVFLGYSAVKVQNMNGGYEIDNFTNFSDYPDNITAPSDFAPLMHNVNWGNRYVGSQISSYAYKRGLLKSKVLYNSAGNKISESINTYTSLDAQPVVSEIGVQDMTWWLKQGPSFGQSTGADAVNFYQTNIENWRLTQTVQNDYDQKNTANYSQIITSYTYCPNKRYVKIITITDSKGATLRQTFFYYANETGIPMVTPGEQTALNAMVSYNRTNVLVHESDIRNSVIITTHNSYNLSISPGNNGHTEPYLAGTTLYKTFNSTTTQLKQQQNAYNTTGVQLTSTASYNGPNASSPSLNYTALSYGYNAIYPVVKIQDANSQTTQTQSTSGFGGSLTTGASYNIMTDYTGNINVSVYGTNSNLTVKYSLSGVGSGTICSSCGSSANISIPNVPPGNYYLIITVTSTSTYPTITCSGNYPKFYTSTTQEFYYEGFEQGGWGSNATKGGAHSGSYYYNGTANYYVPFTLPNSRSYKLQYFSLSGGKWVLNEQNYTGPVTLTGAIDDVRVFPSDALMTTYTYSSQVGITSQTDPSGKTTTYQYDGLGRLILVLDNDNNIIKEYDYEYQK